MSGLFGLGLGFGFFWAEARTGPAWLLWLLFAVSYFLVYRWGRRSGRGLASASATAIATSSSAAESLAASSSSAAVNVYITQPAPPVASRWPGLDTAPWLSAPHLEGRDTRALEADVVHAVDMAGASDADDLDPVEVLDRTADGKTP